MKTTAILSLGALAGLASANINFNWVNPTCNLDGTQAEANKCLTGQHCTDQKTCVPDMQDPFSKITNNPSNTTTSSHPKTAEKRQTNYSTNGQCGPANGNMICDPNSTVYKGTCCSQYGWCGNDAAHCGTGCISGCPAAAASSAAAAPSSAPTTGATAPRSDGRCGTAFGGATCAAGGAFGGCCSAYGYCGSTTAHCLVSNGCQSGCTGSTPSQGTSQAAAASSPAAAPSASAAAPRSDGRCGSTFGGATCAANGPFGGCCSAYGYCGSTTAHCLPSNGCQSGCTGASSAAASPSSTAVSSAAASPSSTAVSSKPVIITPPASSRPPSSTTTGEPVLGKPSSVISSTSAAKSTLIATTDGSCGSQFNNTVCGNWPQGSCCSMYGYCGSTSAHCGEGCQSGPCAVQVLPAPPAKAAPQNQNPGSLKMAGMSGVPAMHAGLMPNGRVVFLDKVENYTQLTLPNGQFAYSSEWDPATQQLAPLAYKTNAFCSGGIFLADGTFMSVGGNAPLTFIDPTVGDGFQAIRLLKRSSSDASLNGQAWNEPGTQLSTPRWYPSVQIMPNDQIFIASGSKNGLDPSVPANNNPTYEWLNADGTPQGVSTNMSILVKNQPYYMYPFMHLLNDGNLFVHVAKSSEIFNPTTGQVVAALPDLPGQYRTYPNTGGSVMLPLSSSNNYAPDIVICGGGPYQDITAPGDPSCGRIQPMSNNPQWEMDSMPEGRCMVEGTLLPDGTVIFLNGAQSGAQGFGVAKNPAFEVLIYDPNQPLGQRFTTGPSSTIARLYHSVALLLPDGTLLISGSNPNQMPILTPDANDPFITEFQNEVYTPPYLTGNATRPTNVQLSTKSLQANGQTFNIQFTAKAGVKSCMVSLYYGGYVTHSVHMGHRMVVLDTTGFKNGSTTQNIAATMPPNKAIAPAGPYMVFVVCDGVPAIGQFVMLS